MRAGTNYLLGESSSLERYGAAAVGYNAPRDELPRPPSGVGAVLPRLTPGTERNISVMAAIEIQGLSKRFGEVQAVDDLSFTVDAGRVTGFLGPNGAGKSTTLRMLLGLIHSDAGAGTFDGRRYEDLPHPSAHVGAVLEDASFHPGRSGRNHLRVLAAAGSHPAERVDEVLDAGRPRRARPTAACAATRWACASAWRSRRPCSAIREVLILDEPANGLDPPGIRWIRDLLRAQAARGRAVLVSSHLLSEVALSADDVVVIAHGRLRESGPLERVLGGGDGPVTRVRARDADAARRPAARARTSRWSLTATGTLLAPRRRAGGRRRGRGRAPHRAVRARDGTRSLEDAFLELTEDET